jgi:hypothetical protein
MRNAVLNRKKPPSPSPAVHQLTLLLLVATSATFLLHKLANVFFFYIPSETLSISWMCRKKDSRQRYPSSDGTINFRVLQV